jgi:hypothetical protein
LRDEDSVAVSEPVAAASRQRTTLSAKAATKV